MADGRFQKGNIPWNAGMKGSEAMKELTKAAIIARLNKPKAPSKKITIECLQCKNPFLVFPCYLNRIKYCTKDCRMIALRARIPWSKGKKFSLEHRKKLSVASMGKTGYWKNKKLPLEISRKGGLQSVIKQQNRKEPTSIEKALYDYLVLMGIVFERQKLINSRFLVDAYIPSLNLVIEADGDYWHGLERVVKKDKKENAYLEKCGYKIIRLSEKEINSGEFKERMVV